MKKSGRSGGSGGLRVQNLNSPHLIPGEKGVVSTSANGTFSEVFGKYLSSHSPKSGESCVMHFTMRAEIEGIEELENLAKFFFFENGDFLPNFFLKIRIFESLPHTWGKFK